MSHAAMISMVRSAMERIRARMRERSGFDIVCRKVSGDPTREIDLEIESLYVCELKRILGSVRIKSEESGWVLNDDNSEFVAIVDPIDGTEMAARQVALFSTAVSILRPDGDLVFSAVGDVGMDQVFWADSTRAFLDDRRLRAPEERILANSFLVNYSMSADRTNHPEWAVRVLERCARFLNYGGPLFLAKIADGTVDGVLEYQKGYFLYDLLPGLHIARNAGAAVCNLSGEPLDLSDFDRRYKFFATSGNALQREILDVMVAYPSGPTDE